MKAAGPGSILWAQDTLQPVDIKKSADKVLIGGKVYYIHVVEKGQTLYSIAKAYNVTEEDIASENVDVLYGPLQIGQALKVPVYPKQNDQERERKKDKKDFILHLVKPQQTLYFLSRKYNVSIDTIIKYNPETASGNLDIDQVVRIPKISINTRERAIEPGPEAEYIVYHVKPKETLYSLSRRFNISVDAIVNENPFLKNDGLKTGQELRIPVTKDKPVSGHLADTSFSDKAMKDDIKNNRLKIEFKCRGSNPDRFRTYRVALLLPFQLHKKKRYNNILDTISGETEAEILNHPVARDYRKFMAENNYFYEFYEGVLLALDSLKNLGFQAEFHVYDTEKNAETIRRQIIPKLETLQPDLIIGPIYQENLKIISDFSLRHHVPFVSPVFKNPWLIETNPFMFQVMPKGSEEIKEASGFISRFSNRNIVLVHRGDSLFVNNIYDFRDNLYRAVNESSEYDNIIITELIYNDSLKTNIANALKKGMPNLVVIPSPREVYVIPLLTELNQLAKHFDIQVFGTSQWQQFKNVDDDYFYNLRVHYHTPFYIDYSNPHVKSFVEKFRQWYNHEPVQVTPKGYNFSYLGYDITFYFMNALRIYGTNFPGCLKYYEPNLLMSDYQFEREDIFSGFTNHSISIIRYNKDYTVSRLEIMKKITPLWNFGSRRTE